VASFLVASGCITPPAVDKTQTESVDLGSVAWAQKPMVYGDKHDHTDWKQHVGLSSPNFQELAYDGLGIPAFGNATAGGYFCGGSAVTDAGQRLTVISSFDTAVAFVLMDTTDPKHPIHLGDYVLDHAQTYDVDITADGKHVVIAADISPNNQPKPGASNEVADSLVGAPVAVPVVLHPKFVSACTGETIQGPDQTVAAGPSTILVSLKDPMKPAFEDLMPSPVIGPHSVSTASIDNVTYVASSITNLVHQASYFQFYKLMDGPTGGKLVLVSMVDAGQYGSPTATFNGHVDAEIAMHPVTNKPVAYLSDWDGGLIILDFSNPAAPVRLSQWADQGADNGALHSTRSIPGVHDGHHYLLAGQEFVGRPSDRPSGWIYILDDTDPTNIVEVGRWTLPNDSDPKWGGVELFSTHYFRVLGDTVFVAMYHGGVWAFKLDFLHPENMKEPRSAGVFVPDMWPTQKPRAPKGGYDYSPFVLDVFPFEDDTLVIYDGLSGVYSVKYDPTMELAAPKPWPAAGQQHAG
jgi:hypothetical protein